MYANHCISCNGVVPVGMVQYVSHNTEQHWYCIPFKKFVFGNNFIVEKGTTRVVLITFVAP
jgi:hypothetical protein